MRKLKLHPKQGTDKMVTARKDDRDRRGGAMPGELKRRMSDLLAKEFSSVGENLYDKSMADFSDVVKKNFDAGVDELAKVVTKKLGELGYQESIKHVRPWLEGIISDMRTKGIPSLGDALDSISSEFSVKYQEGGEEAPAEGADLLEVEVPTAKEEDVEEIPEEASKEDLTAILDGKTPAPAAADEPEVKQESAASTFKDVKRRLRTMRMQRRIEAEVPESREELLKSAQLHIRILEK